MKGRDGETARRRLRFASVCDGIGAAACAWAPLGWELVFKSEIEPFPMAVTRAHFPGVPDVGDMTKFAQWSDYGRIDLVCGGTPCQAFSVAGLRKGLADPRGNLTLTYLAVVAKYRPRWVVWENVPGVLSDGTGAFGAFLGGLGQLGYGFAYRVLDAQYVRVESHRRGVPQRRRRVFVVGHSGGAWQRAAAVLFERASLRGDSPPRRTAGEGIAGTFGSRTQGGGGLGADFECGGGIVAFDETQVTSPGNFSNPQAGEPCHPLARQQRPPAIGFRTRIARNGPGNMGEIASALSAQNGASGIGDAAPCVALAFPQNLSGTQSAAAVELAPALQAENPTTVAVAGPLASHHTPKGHGCAGVNNQQALSGHIVPEVALALQEMDSKGADSNTKEGHLIVQPGGRYAARRLTPRECERLQGFPDDWTAVEFKGKPAADGPRYKALGNSMAVNVMRWIGERLALVDRLAPWGVAGEQDYEQEQEQE